MKRKVLAVALTLALSGFTMVGCGGNGADSSDTGSADRIEQSVDTAEEELIIGSAEQTEDTMTSDLTNGTGKNITGFTVKDSSEEEYPENMLPDNEVFKKDQTRTLYYTPENAESADTDSEEADASEDEKALDPQYDALVTFEDGSELEWEAVPFGDMSDAELRLEDDTLYVVYKSSTTGEEINTLEAAEQSAELDSDQSDDTKSTSSESKSKTSSSDQNSEDSSSGTSSKNSGTSSTGSSSKSKTSSTGSSSSSSGSGSSSSGCVGDEGLVYGGDSGSSGGSSSSSSGGSSSSSSSGSSSSSSGGSSSSSSGGSSSSSSGGSSSSSSGGSGSSSSGGCVGDDGLTY